MAVRLSLLDSPVLRTYSVAWILRVSERLVHPNRLWKRAAGVQASEYRIQNMSADYVTSGLKLELQAQILRNDFIVLFLHLEVKGLSHLAYEVVHARNVERTESKV